MTSIKEHEYDKKINISATKFSCDDVDDTIPKPLPQRGGFAMLIVGRPGYGKTSLINSLVCKSGKCFNRKFDRVFIWSPSMITMEGDPYELVPPEQKFEEATFENIQGVLDEIKDTGEKILFIFDDVICSDVRGKGKGANREFNYKRYCSTVGTWRVMVVQLVLLLQVRVMLRLTPS